MASNEDITKLNLYELFEIPEFSDESLIRKAYHRKALTCHPDKHPDDPKAAERFRKYKQACSILLDENARSDYDKVLKARQYHASRFKELDSKRQKLRDELEEKERRANNYCGRESELDAQIRLREHIERIRREGSKLLDEENQKLKTQLSSDKSKLASSAGQHHSQSGASSGAIKHRPFQHETYSPYRQAASDRLTRPTMRRGTFNQNKLEGAMSDEEYENMVLTKLRTAQQLKRLSLGSEK